MLKIADSPFNECLLKGGLEYLFLSKQQEQNKDLGHSFF